MSTVTLAYPNRIQTHRNASIRFIVVLVLGLVLAASLLLVGASPARANFASSTASSVVAIPNPIAPEVIAQPIPSVTSTPAPSPTVIAVPVQVAPAP